MIFPDDDSGDVLRRMVAGGNDLTVPRNIDFNVVFPDQSSAEDFAERVRELKYQATVGFAQVAVGLPWDVLVVKHMAASYQAIIDFESLLDEIAAPLGGRNDGWGCLSGPNTPTM